MFIKKDYQAVDNMLESLDMSLPFEDLVCTIRTTYPARKKLNNWSNTLTKIKEELDRRGINSSQALRGLPFNPPLLQR